MTHLRSLYLLTCVISPLAICLNSNALDWSGQTIHTNSEAELLKAFIEDPPESGEMVFLYRSSFLPKPRPGSANEKENPIEFFYRSAWHGSDYYIMRFDSIDHAKNSALTNVMEVGGMFQGKPWYYMLTRGVLKISEDKLEDSKDVDVRNMHGLFESRFGSSRGFGVLHKSGSFEWNGVNFRANAYENDVKLTGYLSLDKSLRPEKIYLFATNKNQLTSATVVYSYGSSADGVKLPESYSVLMTHGTNTLPFGEARYYSISLPNNSSIDDFSPQKVIANLTAPKFNIVMTNSTEFFVVKDSRREAIHRVGKNIKFIAFALIILSVLPITFLCWKLRNKQIKKELNEI